MKEKEIEDLRVIRVFDDGSNALSEMMNYLDGINHSNMCLEVTEKDVLMNVANLVCNFMLLHEAGEISKDDLDLYLGKKDYLANAHPLEFNFLFQSSINGRIYTNRPYYLDDLDEEEAHSSILDCYSVLSIMYLFDSIIEKMREMVTDFKAAHKNFDTMTKDERLSEFWSWQENENYMKNDYLENLLDKCKKTYAVLYHEISGNKEED